jgi:flagellar export protein FliJ
VAAFKFRLASVLCYRERTKQQKQWEIDGLIAARRLIETEIHALDQQLAHAAEAVTGEEGQILTALQLRLYGDYAQQMAQRIKDRERALEKCEENIALKRQELIEAMRAVKALEQLRTRLEKKFRREQNIEEQKSADEISQRKFADPETRKKIPH